MVGVRDCAKVRGGAITRADSDTMRSRRVIWPASYVFTSRAMISLMIDDSFAWARLDAAVGL